MQTVTNADGAAVEVADKNAMVHRAVSGLQTDPEGTRVVGHQSLSGLSMQVGMPLLCPDTETDPWVDPASCRRAGIRSIAVAPMMRAGEAVGALRVVSSEAEHFDDADLAVLELMANLITSGLSATSKLEREAERALATPSRGSPTASSSWIGWPITGTRLAATAGRTGFSSSALTSSPW